MSEPNSEIYAKLIALMEELASTKLTMEQIDDGDAFFVLTALVRKAIMLRKELAKL